MATEFVNQHHHFDYKKKCKEDSLPLDFSFKSTAKVIEEIKNSENNGRIIVICTNLNEAKFCTFLLNAGTSLRFTCIDHVPRKILPSSVDHLVIDFNNLHLMKKRFSPYDTCIIWNS